MEQQQASGGDPLASNGNNAAGDTSKSEASRPVARAACLNCRTAKRRCDGAQPVCGPCVARSIPASQHDDDGGCAFVASKRGGPRYKGVKGADMERVRQEREKAVKEKLASAGSAGAAVPGQEGGDGASSAADSTTNSSVAGKKRKAGPSTGGNGSAQKSSSSHSSSSSSPSATRSPSGTSAGTGAKRKTKAAKTSQGDSTDRKQQQSQQHKKGMQAHVPSQPYLQAAGPMQPPYPNTGAACHPAYSSQQHQGVNHPPPPPPAAAAYYPGKPGAHQSQSGGAGSTNDPILRTVPQTHSHQPQALSLANLELWQRVQAQAAAFAASGGQSYALNMIPQQHAQQGQFQQQQQYSAPMGQQTSAQQPLVHVQPQLSSQAAMVNHQQQQQSAPVAQQATASGTAPSGAESGAQPQQPVMATAAEMEKWMDFNSLDNFFNSVELLPKAGVIGQWGEDEEDGLVTELLSGTASSPATSDVDSVDSEQQARSLLSLYYRYVYPWLAVLLPPGHLSTYAFFFSEGRPSALLSAIAACVAICCKEEEAALTIRSSKRRAAAAAQHHSKNGNSGNAAAAVSVPGEHATREEIARYHCRVAEILLQRDRELLDSVEQGNPHPAQSRHRLPGLGGSNSQAASNTAPTGLTADANAASPAGSSGLSGMQDIDIELLQIEKAATRVLLAHYHYGAGPDATHRLAFDHAKRAWMMAARWDLRRPPAPNAGENANRAGGFDQADRCEWKRRIHWLAYTAATHLSCLGGFRPLEITKNHYKDWDLRPRIEHDDAAFGVYIRGAQAVSRAYASVYGLDSIRQKVSRIRESEDIDANQKQAALQRVVVQRDRVLAEMNKLDNDLLNFTRFDPIWNKNERNFSLSDDPDINLATGLRISGKLMTSGALVILHRTAAFGNARIFLEPQCGIPGAQALEDNFENFFNVDAIPGDKSDMGSSHPSNSMHQSTSGTKRNQNTMWHRSEETGEGQHGGASDDEQEHVGGAEDRAAQNKKHLNSRPGGIPTWTPKSGRAANGLGCAPDDDLSNSLAPSPAQPLLTEEGDRFADGPFDPMVSFERCRFAAYTQWTTLGHVLKHLNPGNNSGDSSWTDDELHTAPLLPPLSCCSYVLGAYAMLMQCLYVQLYGQDKATADVLRSRAWQIERALQRFVRHWNTLADYRSEVATLLIANQSLVEQKNDASGMTGLRGSTAPYKQETHQQSQPQVSSSHFQQVQQAVS